MSNALRCIRHAARERTPVGSIHVSSIDGGKLENACGCYRLWMFDRRSCLRPALRAWLFLTPLSSANHWGRDVFAFALAVQNLLWGMAQPVAGAIADRFGATRVLCAGAILYALGLMLMAHSTSAAMLDLSAGALIGFGLSGTTFPIVLAAFGKILPPEWRSTAFGLGTAAGSFGQFLFSPLAVFLMDVLGWQNALVAFGIVILIVLPLRWRSRRWRRRQEPRRPPRSRCERRSAKRSGIVPTCC